MHPKFCVKIHPSLGSSDYLKVSDALNQVLDLIQMVEIIEEWRTNEQQIVWRLTDAHTSSLPITMVAEPFSKEPDESVASIAVSLSHEFNSEFQNLLAGNPSDAMADDKQKVIHKILDRNMNGIGRTIVHFGENEPIQIRPQSAQKAKTALDLLKIKADEQKADWERIEIGTAQGEFCRLTTWHRKPAIEIIERLSQKAITCILSGELSKEIGSQHQWNEIWEKAPVNVTGQLHYNSEGKLHRVDIQQIEKIEWANIPLSDLKKINILEGRTPTEHLDLIRKEDDE